MNFNSSFQFTTQACSLAVTFGAGFFLGSEAPGARQLAADAFMSLQRVSASSVGHGGSSWLAVGLPVVQLDEDGFVATVKPGTRVGVD